MSSVSEGNNVLTLNGQFSHKNHFMISITVNNETHQIDVDPKSQLRY